MKLKIADGDAFRGEIAWHWLYPKSIVDERRDRRIGMGSLRSPQMMPLREISLKLDRHSLPDEVREWIRIALSRADDFYSEGLGLRYPKCVLSDPAVVHAAIAYLKKRGLLRGDLFCEWGSGFGIASGIASLLGMTAYGIEIESELVERSTQLAKEMGVKLEILQIDYLPEGFGESEGLGGKDLVMPEAWTSRGGLVGLPTYEGLDPDEVDLFFVYPWPGQEEMMMDLFCAVASHGAILLIYLGEGEISAYIREETGEW